MTCCARLFDLSAFSMAASTLVFTSSRQESGGKSHERAAASHLPFAPRMSTDSLSKASFRNSCIMECLSRDGVAFSSECMALPVLARKEYCCFRSESCWKTAGLSGHFLMASSNKLRLSMVCSASSSFDKRWVTSSSLEICCARWNCSSSIWSH